MLSIIIYAQSLKWFIPTSLMLAVSPIVYMGMVVGRILTLPFPARVYRRFDDALYASYQKLVIFFFHSGGKINVYGDVECLSGKKENAIFICNHQCTMDWIVANIVALQNDSLGHVRYIIKDGLKYFPLYGFYFKQHQCIFVTRGKFNEKSMEKQVDRLRQKSTPVFMVIFPEGTRFHPENTESLKRNQQLAEMRGTKPLESVFFPKYRALKVCLEQLQGHARFLYDVTIAYNNTIDENTGNRKEAPGMLEFLQSSSSGIHLYIERIDIKEIPTSEPEIQTWLDQQFEKKDRLLSHFYSQEESIRGTFPGDRKLLSIPLSQTLPAAVFYLGSLGLLMSSSQTRSLYWKVGLYGTILGCFWMSFRSQS